MTPRRQRAALDLSLGEFAELLALPQGTRVQAVYERRERERVVILVEADVLDYVEPGCEAPRITLDELVERHRA